MSRNSRPDSALDALNEEREDLAIQVSLLADAEIPEPARLAILRDKLFNLERRISNHRPAEA
jgi:hypothetical protein